MTPKVAISLLIFSSLRVGRGAIDTCSVPPENIAVYEGALNTLLYFPTSPNGVKWTILATTNDSTEVTIVNYDDTVASSYAADYAFNSSGLIIKSATTTADYYIHQLSTAGIYTAQCSDGTHFSFKFLVVRQGPTGSIRKLDATRIEVICSSIYADSTYVPIAAMFTLFVNGNRVASDTPQRTCYDGYTWISKSTFTAPYSSSSTYQCGQTFGQPTEVQDPNIARNSPSFNGNFSLITPGAALAFDSAADQTDISPSGCPLSIMTSTRLSTTSTTSTTTTTNTPSTSSTKTSVAAASSSSIATTAKLPTSSTTSITTNRPEASTSSVTTILSVAYMYPSLYTTTAPSTTAFPITMEPLFGPVAGGTNIMITGSSPSVYPPSNSGSYTPDIRDAINVYIGYDLHATSVTFLPDVSSTFELVAVTPKTTDALIGQPLPIIIEFSSSPVNLAPFNMTFNRTFIYQPNPNITSIYPNRFNVIGGILLDVTGQSLSSVAKPVIQLKVVITRAAENGSTLTTSTNTSSRLCIVLPRNDTYMQCPMPPLILPEEFLGIINSVYNTSAYRKRRSRDPVNTVTVNNHGLLSRVKRDVTALTVTGTNGVDRADIYLGFILDGVKEYENINDALPDTRLIFYSAPEINSPHDLIEFDPSVDELIYIKGRYMMRGCRIIDYVVHIGNQICANNDLQDNQLSCRPPKVEPSSTVNDTIYCGQQLRISITLGYYQHIYACLTYTGNSRRIYLIIGLTVGLGVFVILLTILIVCIVRCRNSKVREETDRLQHTRGVELRTNRHTQNAERPGSKRDLNIIHTRQNLKTIYQPNDDYGTALQVESHQNYGHQIQEYDTNI